jgi:hypothetical protein
MSLYRFARASALLALASRYRLKIFSLAFTVGLALVTSWQFDDIAAYLERYRPEWLAAALIIKTLLVYGALVYAFWLLRPGSWADNKTDAKGTTPAPAEPIKIPEQGPLDDLLDKPRLKSRKDAILQKPSKHP